MSASDRTGRRSRDRPPRSSRDSYSSRRDARDADRRYRDADRGGDVPRTLRGRERERQAAAEARELEDRRRRAASASARERDLGPDAEYGVRRRAGENRRRTEPRGAGTGQRILHAVPMIAFAIAIVVLGGPWFALGVFGLGVIALHELYGLMRRVRPIDIAGFIGLGGLIGAALLGDRDAMLVVLAAVFPVVFAFALARPNRQHVAWGIAATLFGVLWIGLALGHAVLIRELPDGAGLVTDILIGVFVGDTCAYFGGRAWGRRPLAPGISPSKTVEGLIAGVIGGTFAFWGFAVGYQDFLPGGTALAIGFCVTVASPIGDLFESLVKRDLEVKDTGSFFGSHGGVLDRLDGVLFAAVVGYYASIALI